MYITCVRWGGEGLIYSASRDGCINVWDAAEGKLVRTLKGHGHWVNTLALSTEYVLRTGVFDHTGSAPADPQEAQQVRGIRGAREQRSVGVRDVGSKGSEGTRSEEWLCSQEGCLGAVLGGSVLTVVVRSVPTGAWGSV